MDRHFFFCVICSLHLSLYMAAWVTFDGVQPGLFCASQSILRKLHVYLSGLSSSLSFLIHILRIESLFLALRVADRFHSENAGPLVTGRSRACALVSFPILHFAFRSNAIAIAMASFRVGGGIRSCTSSELILRSEY